VRVRGSRAARAGAARRQRLAEVATAVVIAAVGIWYAAGQAAAGARGGAGGGAGRPAGARPATLAVLQVTGARVPLVAVIGAGGTPAPAAVVLPASLRITVPGQGDATIE
jgi:hypothetical protein